MLSCFVKNFEDKTNIVYWLAYEAMASLCENEHKNMLKMGPAGMCDTAAGALTKLELCNFGGVIVTETVEDVMANGTLAQKEWVAEAVIESTEEIPARMREQLIALEDSIGSSMRKALKEKLDV